MNPVLRELQRQLNDIAKQLDDLQRQETIGGGGSFGSKFAVTGTSSDIASFEVDGTFARVYFVSYRDSALTHGEFKGRASRGSKASPTAIQSGDLIFAIRAEGYGTSAWPGGNTAEVSLEADGAHTNSSQPGRIVFKTAQSGATGSTEAMRIDSQQRVGISNELRVGASSQYLSVRRAGVTLTNSGFTTVLSSLTGVSLVMFQVDNNQTYYGGTLMCMLNSATLQIATVSVSNVVSGVPTGFNIGYQASGSALQLRAGPSWPATVGVNVAVLQLTW